MALSKERASEQNQQLKSGGNFYEWKEKNHLRFLPLFNDEGEWNVPYAQHFLKVSENKTLALYCAKFGPFFEKECTCCSIQKAGKDFLSKEDYKELFPTKRGLALVIDIDEPKLGVQMARVPISVVKLLNQYIKDDYDFGDLDEGAGVTITREGSGMSTEYKLSPYKQGKVLPVSELMDREEVEAAMEEMDPEEFIRADDAEAKAEFAKACVQWRPELKPVIPKALLMGDTSGDDSDEGTEDAEFEELPPCYGKEWEDGDADCEDCPHEDDCREKQESKEKKKAKGKKGKAKGKPARKPKRGRSKLSSLM